MPENWQDRSLITLIGETGAAGIAANIVVTRETVDRATSVEDYAAQQKQAIAAEVPNLEVLDERSIVLNDAPAFQRLQRFAVDDLAIQQVQTFVLVNAIVFSITGTAHLADFNNSIHAFKEFTENFRATAE